MEAFGARELSLEKSESASGRRECKGAATAELRVLRERHLPLWQAITQ
jgi:hypothetical protein